MLFGKFSSVARSWSGDGGERVLEQVQVSQELEEAVHAERVLIIDRVVSVDLLDALHVGLSRRRQSCAFNLLLDHLLPDF